MPPNRTHLTVALVVGTVLGSLTIALGARAWSAPPPTHASLRSGGDGSGGGHGDGSGGGHGRNRDGGADDGGSRGR